MYDGRSRSRLRSPIDRRSFFGVAGSVAGLGLAGCAASGRSTRVLAPGSGKTQRASGTSTVSIARNTDRRQVTYDSLKPLQSDVRRAIGEKQVIIKVNAGFPTEDHRIHSTYPEQVSGILDFLREFYDGPVIIAEGVGSSKTGNMMEGYELYGIASVAREDTNISMIDANRQPLAQKWIHQYREHPIPINIIEMYFNPNNYIISAARLKTHNAVVGTYSLKNIVMGSPVGQVDGRSSEKGKMHGGDGSPGGTGQELSYNIFRLALEGVYPDLGVVDGLTGIEGDGPWDGTAVEHNISVASTDFVACDRICTDVMEIDPFLMKYLEWCGDAGLGNWSRENIRTIGVRPEEVSIKYALNKNVESQVAWIHENFER